MTEPAKDDPDPAPERPTPSGVNRNMSISGRLRELYGAVQEEAIPDRFLDLLDRLDRAERQANSAEIK